MRRPVDRAITGIYVAVIGWLGAISGWLLAAPLVLWAGFFIGLWGCLLAWLGIVAELRRRREHR